MNVITMGKVGPLDSGIRLNDGLQKSEMTDSVLFSALRIEWKGHDVFSCFVIFRYLGSTLLVHFVNSDHGMHGNISAGDVTEF